MASLISVSLQDIQQNPQDTSNFYLSNIYQLLADPNRPNISSSLPTSPPPFSPPTFAVWVNSLWFLSLAISITCALLATLLQQWARRYLKVTQTRSSLHKRARIRSFFAEGVEKSHLTWVVEALPTLIHLSLSLFFAGLVVFLWNVNLTIFKLVLSWIGVCTAFYGFITFIPIFLRDSPYYSPLTPLVRRVVLILLFVFLVLYLCLYGLVYCCSLCWKRCHGQIHIFGRLWGWLHQFLSTAVMKPEEIALKVSSEIDTRAFTWTFDSLDEDHELERFFSGLPGLYNSEVLKEPLHGLDDQQKLRLLEAVIRLLDRTFSSNLLTDQVKRQRADICANAIKIVYTPDAFPKIVRRLASEDGYGPLQSFKIVEFIRQWGNRELDRKHEYPTLDQAIFSIIIARVQQHDDAWFNFASDQLGIPETVLRSHAAHGDNLSLALLIYVTRQQFTHIGDTSWSSNAISDVLEAASKFNAEDTSPDLQHEFCALWNQVVLRAQEPNDWKISKCILKPIRHVYIRLHHDTNSAPTLFSASTSGMNNVLDDPDSYPVCNAPSHVQSRSDSNTRPHPVPHDYAALSPPSLTNLDAPSLPVPAPFHVDESLNTPPSLNNSHSTPQTVDNLRVPVTPPAPATTDVMREIVVARITTPLPTSETSFPTSASPLSFASRQPGVSLQHNADLLEPSEPPNHSSSASSNAVIDDIIHTGPSLSSPVTRSDL